MTELDVLLAGPANSASSQDEIARQNAAAMAQLAALAPGALLARPPRKPAKKKGDGGDA